MKYSAYYIEETDGSFIGSVAELDLEKPSDGFVQIKVSHSSLNFKDALCTFNSGIMIMMQ